MATKKKLKLTDERQTFRPFSYPWAYDAFLQSEQMHWLHSEIPMLEDVNDWKNKLTEAEKNFLTHIFRFFTQGDIDVAGAYVKNYLPVFPAPEIRMMLSSFAAREAIHIAAYSHLIETLGMPESTYNEFLEYAEMKEKHDYVSSFIGDVDGQSVAEKIAVFSAFTEGLQLFSSFVMLLNFTRFGKMKGMGQIISWSIADEAVIEGTEVLTESGWTPIQSITLTDKVMQYDMDTKNTSYVNPQKIQQVTRDESFVFESNSIHQHVSPNHRMITMTDSGLPAEVKAKDANLEERLIISGMKNSGDSILSEEDSLCIKMIVSGQLEVQWIYEKMPHVSSKWAKEAVDLYLGLLTN